MNKFEQAGSLIDGNMSLESIENMIFELEKGIDMRKVFISENKGSESQSIKNNIAIFEKDLKNPYSSIRSLTKPILVTFPTNCLFLE